MHFQNVNEKKSPNRALSLGLIFLLVCSLLLFQRHSKVISYPIPVHTEVDDEWITRLYFNPCVKYGDSQLNQDCILDEIFSKIGTTNKYFVEYGFNSQFQCAGSGPNTCHLYKIHNWTGLLLDNLNENPEINLRKHALHASNIVEIFHKYGVPREFDFLSADMDSHDFFVLHAILSGGFRPRVIATEYNQNWPKGLAMTLMDPSLLPPGNKGGVGEPFIFQQCLQGVSAYGLKALLEPAGYSTVAITSPQGLDLFWVRNDILQPFHVPKFRFFTDRMRLGELLHERKEDLKFLDRIADAQVFLETNDISKAHEAGLNRVNELLWTGKMPCLPDREDK